MKPRKPEYEGPVLLPNGIVAADTGDRWHSYMPREFWTAEARKLFKASKDAGLIWLDDNDRWQPCEGITKAQLAYWCKKASSYLGIDRGSLTNRKAFEKVFGRPARIDPLTGERLKASNPLKANSHDIYNQVLSDKNSVERYEAPIDELFAALEASDNEQK